MALQEPDERPWRDDVENAPRNGDEIEAGYQEGNQIFMDYIVWSERPVCMGGNRVGGQPPGWATGMSSNADTNLPVDPPDFWRPVA
ncbi:hypothetical protein [Salipiger sp. PrR003]|uniref:hypothetical protein n=1 Tax=Salipiger sp. PrR003 TaxID=2706776 RepID=UPI0013DA9D20|nr:hypothetical protein [Salipiger sp. PrR003]NDV51512.1 hypothetical protein [Salipiger sp. PrR003]